MKYRWNCFYSLQQLCLSWYNLSLLSENNLLSYCPVKAKNVKCLIVLYSLYFIFRQQKYFQKSHHLLSVIITCIFLHNCRHSGGCLREYFLCIICHICTKRYLEIILGKHLSSAKKRLSILHIIRFRVLLKDATELLSIYY